MLPKLGPIQKYSWQTIMGEFLFVSQDFCSFVSHVYFSLTVKGIKGGGDACKPFSGMILKILF